MRDAGLWLAVSAGGAVGAVLRGSVYRLVAAYLRRGDVDRPRRLGLARATLLVNVVGSFFLGFGAIWLPTLHVSSPVHVFWLTGFCGSLTTFSTFCADAVRLAGARERGLFAGYLLANCALSVLAYASGVTLAGVPGP